MIKGGYTSFDLSGAVASQDPVTIPGIYQKCKDTIGKPAVVSFGGASPQAWGWIMASDGFAIFTQIYSDGAYLPVYATITDKDVVTITVVTPDEG